MGKRHKPLIGTSYAYQSYGKELSKVVICCGVATLMLIIFIIKRDAIFSQFFNREALSKEERLIEIERLKYKLPYVMRGMDTIQRVSVVFSGASITADPQSGFYEISRRGTLQAIERYNGAHHANLNEFNPEQQYTDVFLAVSSRMFDESYYDNTQYLNTHLDSFYDVEKELRARAGRNVLVVNEVSSTLDKSILETMVSIRQTIEAVLSQKPKKFRSTLLVSIYCAAMQADLVSDSFRRVMDLNPPISKRVELRVELVPTEGMSWAGERVFKSIITKTSNAKNEVGNVFAANSIVTFSELKNFLILGSSILLKNS